MLTHEKIKVLIVDDHPFLRIGVAAIINSQHNMVVSGQAGDIQEGQTEYARERPDVTLIDLRLPSGSGVQLIRAIRNSDPKARFVVLTTYDGDEDIFQAMAAGAQAYLLKGMPHRALIDAIQNVHAGCRYFPAPVENTIANRTPTRLSARERQVLALLVQGRSNREIAEELSIAEATVKCHVSVIFGHLGANDRTQAVVAALKRGLEHL